MGAGTARVGLAGQRRAEQAARAGGERVWAGEREAGRRRLLWLAARARGDSLVEAWPAAGLGDLLRRRPLALEPASASRAGTHPPRTLARRSPRTGAGHAVSAGVSSRDDRGPAPPAPHALSDPRPAPGTVPAC